MLRVEPVDVALGRQVQPLTSNPGGWDVVRAVLSAAFPKGMDATARAVFLAIWTWFNPRKGSECYCPATSLAKMTGMSRWTVLKAIRRLESVNLITCRREKGQTTWYTINPVWMASVRTSQTGRGRQPVVESNRLCRSTGVGAGNDRTGSNLQHEVAKEADEAKETPPPAASQETPPPEGSTAAPRRDVDDNLVHENGLPLEDLDPTVPHLIFPELLRRQMNGETPGDGHPATPRSVAEVDPEACQLAVGRSAEDLDPEVCVACHHTWAVHGDVRERGCMAIGCSCGALVFPQVPTQRAEHQAVGHQAEVEGRG